MKIAIPTNNNVVDGHFGHCAYYTIFTVDENKQITTTEMLKSPAGCGCKSNIAETLSQIGVKVLLAGNMGQGAVNVINAQGIDVVRGCEGDVSSVAKEWLAGNITDNATVCSDHTGCNH